MTLQEIFNEIGNLSAEDRGGNDKGGQIHTYLDIYDKLFKPFQKGCMFLEIGLATGDSMELWDRYFENSLIVGVDISVVFPKKEYKNNVLIYEADATKPTINDVLGELEFDIVCEDSSHMEADQVAIFELLKPRMKPGGVYIIEDILALDQNRRRFEALHDNCEIIDMRSNGRFDNVLIVYRF